MSRILNVSAVKERAVVCSKLIRANKFGRVSESFVAEIQLEVETFVRSLDLKYPSKTHEDLPCPNTTFVTGELLEKIRERLDQAVARLIQRRVEQHPSIGSTLQGK